MRRNISEHDLALASSEERHPKVAWRPSGTQKCVCAPKISLMYCFITRTFFTLELLKAESKGHAPKYAPSRTRLQHNYRRRSFASLSRSDCVNQVRNGILDVLSLQQLLNLAQFPLLSTYSLNALTRLQDRRPNTIALDRSPLHSLTQISASQHTRSQWR